MRLLFIEDDLKLASLVAAALREEGFAVDLSHDGDDGVFRATEQDYDAIILDVLFPGGTGSRCWKHFARADIGRRC